jgi:hypothetical protein
MVHAATGTGRSSNGRTADSDSAYRGSNPCLPANLTRSRSFAWLVGRPSVTSRFASAQRVSPRLIANGSESLLASPAARSLTAFSTCSRSFTRLVGMSLGPPRLSARLGSNPSDSSHRFARSRTAALRLASLAANVETTSPSSTTSCQSRLLLMKADTLCDFFR